MLVEVATSLGFPLRKQGRSWGGKRCPVCGEGGDGSNRLSVFVSQDGKERWRCFACSAGGDAADFIAAAKGITLREALREVGDKLVPVAEKHNKTSSAELPVPTYEGFVRQLPVRDGKVVSYLKGRGLSEKTIDEAVRRGILRMLPADPYASKKLLEERVGEGELRKLGLLKSSWPAIAFRPLVFIMPGAASIECRIIKPSTDKDTPKSIRYGQMAWPWFWKSENDTLLGRPITKVTVVEGAIDMLSLVELGLEKGEAVMGIPGVSAWKPAWFDALKMKHPGAKICVGLDNDDAGNSAADAIMDACKTVGLSAGRVIPPSGAKDWNDALCMLLKKAA